MAFSWNTPNKNKNKVQKAKQTANMNLEIGDTVVVNYDPFGKHKTRHALIEGFAPNGYKVRFTSTKGTSCDGDNRKVFQKKDGSYVTTTEITAIITYKQIL